MTSSCFLPCRAGKAVAVFGLSAVLSFSGLPAWGQTCGDARVATAVPQTRPGMGANESLWPTDFSGAVTFRPASNSQGVPYSIPNDRDSTSYVTQTIPGEFAGHELFMDVARLDGNDDWIFVAYNAGIQVWDLRTDPANPTQRNYREGWQHHFFEFPKPGEVDTYVESIDVVQSGGDVLLTTVGRNGHGISIWEFTAPSTLTQHCQDTTKWARQVEMIQHTNGRAYAFVSDNTGVHVYDATGSTGAGTACTYEGKVGTMSDGNYLSVLQKDGEVFVAASDGNALPAAQLGLQIWKVDPLNPGSADLLVSDFNTNTRGPVLFEIPGAVDSYFLGLIESGSLKFYDIESCLDFAGVGTCSVGSPLAQVALSPATGNLQFVDISQSADGRTWAYYGLETTFLTGSKVEQLLDVTPLASASGTITLEEITDGADTYFNTSPCHNTLEVDYWGDYYTDNLYGRNFVIPRHGIFINDYFYRAAYSMFDIHEIVDADPVQSISTSLSGNPDSLWLDETASYTASAGGVCNPANGNWCWVVEAAGTGGDSYGFAPNLGSCSGSYTNPEAFDYNCTPGAGKSRCSDGTATVTAWNTSCGSFPPLNTQTSSASVTLKDPTVDIEGALDTNGTTSYQQCQTVPLDATLGGRGPITWQWMVDGEAVDGCAGSVGTATDISSVDVQCLWDTSGVQLEDIFADSFESGDVSLWSSAVGTLPDFTGNNVRSTHHFSRAVYLPKGVGASVNAQVSLVVSNGGELDSEMVTINVAEIADPTFVNPGNPIGTPVVVGNVATISAPANDTSTWSWEVEDPDNGTATCSFDGGAMCATVDTITDTLEYAWQQDGTYTFKVSISNCQSAGSVNATSQVTVADAVEPAISVFQIAPGETSCCGVPNFEFKCVAGQEISMQVLMAEEAPSYTFGFDWERTSTGSATYATQSPDSSTGSTYNFTHTFSNSGSSRTVFPIVQVTSGLSSDTQPYFTSGGAVTVLPAGSPCQ